MADIRPFAALRPKPELASQICELPYDVMSSNEARDMAKGNALSFLRVSKPEIDLDPGIAPDDPAVYAKGSENFKKLQDQGALFQDEAPYYYLYRQIMGSHAQIGLVAAASCQEYLDGVIQKHEFTRPDKEDDRVRHLEALSAQTGPVFLTYRRRDDMDQLVAERVAQDPEVDFTAGDGVRHSAWTVADPDQIQKIRDIFADIPRLYIADGHHRSAAAGRVYQSMNGAGTSGQFLTVIFPDNQMQILPYNRALKDLNGLTPDELLSRLAEVCEVEAPGAAQPASARTLGFYMGGQWRSLKFKADKIPTENPIGSLDVSLLQDLILAPMLGIDNPRTNKRIEFIGGIRGTGELEKRVNNGEFACAFSMYPTGIHELMEIADQDGVMPPKSTWFEPKLRDGLFSHLIES